MIETFKLQDDTSMQLLHGLIGKNLHAYEAYLLVEDPDQARKTVRLDFAGTSVLLVNEHQTIPLGIYADDEEVAILNVVQDEGEELWCPPRKRISRKSGIGLYVEDIYLVVDTVELTKGDIPVNKLKLTQAVVFRDGGRLIAFDRDVWYDEYIAIREGYDIDDLVRDASGDWIEDPPYGYKFTRDIISVGLGGIRV